MLKAYLAALGLFFGYVRGHKSSLAKVIDITLEDISRVEEFQQRIGGWSKSFRETLQVRKNAVHSANLDAVLTEEEWSSLLERDEAKKLEEILARQEILLEEMIPIEELATDRDDTDVAPQQADVAWRALDLSK